MSTALKELREKSGQLGNEIKKLNERVNDPKHDWSTEDEQEWKRVNDDFDTNAERIEQIEAANKRMSDIDSRMNPNRDPDGPGRDDQQRFDGDQRDSITDADRLTAIQGWLRTANDLEPLENHQKAAKRTGLRLGSRELNLRAFGNDVEYGSEMWDTSKGHTRRNRVRTENRDMSVGTNADGGFTIPTGFMNELEETMLQFNGPRRVSRILRTATGNDLPWPDVDDTSNKGALLAESTTIGSSVDPTFGQKTLNAYKYSSKPILISQELLEDSAFNLGAIIPRMLGTRIGRITAEHFTTGTGSGQPNGLVTATSVGKTTASATAITAQELIDLEHSIDPAYRSLPSVGYMFHDNILAYLRKLVDGQNRPLWQEGMSGGTPNTINNRPYTINQEMASAITTGLKTMLFGAFEKYVIRDVANVRLYRLEERYRDLDQTGFVMFSRHDGELINTGAIKHLAQL